jgi:hypothetical protein
MMGRTWFSVPIGRTGIRIGRSVADWRLPGWRRYELRKGLQAAAEAHGETRRLRPAGSTGPATLSFRSKERARRSSSTEPGAGCRQGL